MDGRMRMVFALIAVASLGFTGACDKNKQKTDEEKPEASKESSDESEGEGAEESASASEDTGTAEKGRNVEGTAEEAGVDPALLKPEEADEEAPETFKVRFETTSGMFIGKFHREWAPNGVDRLYNLVKLGYYENVAFFRVIDGFMAQFGLHGTPEVNEVWTDATIEDDPVKESNKKGSITFAKRKKPNSRTTQLFINYRDNVKLDDRGFAPVGTVVEGMDVVEELYGGYEEEVSQKKLRERGNSYLKEEFPELDYIETAELAESE